MPRQTTAPTTTSKRGAVEACRDGQFTWINPPVPGLRDAFYTVRHRTRPDKEHGYSLQPRIFPLVKRATYLTGEKCWKCQAGLEPLVVQWLEEHGYEVQRGGAPLPPPNLDALEGLEPYDELFLQTVRKHDHALFRCQPGEVDLNRLIGKVAMAWRRKRILVLATRVKDCRRLGKYLKQSLSGSEVTVHTGRDFPQRAGRIVVATSTGWNEGRVGIRRRQILMALNPDELLRKQLGQIAIEQAEQARLYGLLPVSRRLAPYDRDMVTAAFGPREVRIERRAQFQQPVRVVFTRWKGHLFTDSELDAFAVKKQGVWHHGPRNRHVAELATALAEGDEGGLRRRFPAVCEAIQGQMPERVGVLVENVEHRLTLAKLLPGWAVISGHDVCLDGLSPQDRRILRGGGEDQQQNHAIVTMASLPEAGCLDGLIRADAGADGAGELIYVNGFLVDLDDHHHPWLQQRCRERRGDYLRRGWTVDGKSKSDDLLSTFMSTRPSRRRVKPR
jgi:hypothetical protein